MSMTLPVAVPDNTQVGSPLWLLYHLKAKLDAEAPRLVQLDNYYHGIQDIPHVTDPEIAADLRHLLVISASNYMRVVVNAKKQRTRLQGFRLKDDADAVPDEQTWEMYQANEMDTQLPILWQTAYTQRRGYLSVWYPQAGDDPRYPVIRVESPTQVTVDHDPSDRRRRRAGLKIWVDDWTGAEHANVVTATEITKWRWEPATRTKPYSGWVFREETVPNRLGEVFFYPIANMPTLSKPDGWSEIDDLIVIQDRINRNIFNRQVAEHFTAFMQKWATGLEVPVDPETGLAIQSFVSAINSFWLNEDPAGKFGAFPATDLKNYGVGKESDVQDISVISGTPRHYFTVNGQAPSGDSMKSADSALVAGVTDFTTNSAAGGLKLATAAARRVMGLDTPVDMEVLWADPEYQTLGQLVDSHVKLYAAKILPRRDVLEKLGYTPPQISRIEAAMLQADLMSEALALPQEAAPSAPSAPSAPAFADG